MKKKFNRYRLNFLLCFAFFFITHLVNGQKPSVKSNSAIRIYKTMNVTDSIKNGKYPLIIAGDEPLDNEKRVTGNHNNNVTESGQSAALHFYPLPMRLASSEAKKIRLDACTAGKTISNEFGAWLQLTKVRNVRCQAGSLFTYYLMGNYLVNGDPITKLSCKVEKGKRYLVSFEVQNEFPSSTERSYKISYSILDEHRDIVYTGTKYDIIHIYLEAPPDAPNYSTSSLTLYSADPGEYKVKSVTIENIR